MFPILLHDCDNCGASEERVFSDSHTGLDLCVPCLYPIIGQIALSPSDTGDNLRGLLTDEDEVPA